MLILSSLLNVLRLEELCRAHYARNHAELSCPVLKRILLLIIYILYIHKYFCNTKQDGLMLKLRL